MVEHQDVDLRQQRAQLPLGAGPPAVLEQGDGPAGSILEIDRLVPMAQGDQAGAPCMPTAQQGAAQGAASAADRHGEGRGRGEHGAGAGAA